MRSENGEWARPKERRSDEACPKKNVYASAPKSTAPSRSPSPPKPLPSPSYRSAPAISKRRSSRGSLLIFLLRSLLQLLVWRGSTRFILLKKIGGSTEPPCPVLSPPL
ncbi:hypothetical protein VPH35_007844 [Triticum aestivum]